MKTMCHPYSSNGLPPMPSETFYWNPLPTCKRNGIAYRPCFILNTPPTSAQTKAKPISAHKVTSQRVSCPSDFALQKSANNFNKTYRDVEMSNKPSHVSKIDICLSSAASFQQEASITRCSYSKAPVQTRKEPCW